MLTEKEQKHYQPITLNRIFAVTSLLFMGSLIWMFADDYERSWKRYQKQFRQLESKKVEMTYNSQNYDEWLMWTEEERVRLRAEEDRKAAENKLKKAKDEHYKVDQNFKFGKAKYDELTYRYKEAQAGHKGDPVELRRELDSFTYEGRLLFEGDDSWKVALGKLEAKVTNAENELQALKEKEKDIDKRFEQELGREQILAAKQHEKLEVTRMSMANKIADKIRDLPILDLTNPYYRVQQVVIDDVIEEMNFAQVPKVDRCMTCHQGMTKSSFSDEPHPYKTHPNLDLFLTSASPHPVDEFGCTSCHSGRGRGTSFVSAVHMPSSHQQELDWHHGHIGPMPEDKWHQMHHWPRPMRPAKYTQAGCFKCHAETTNLKGAEKLNLGLALVERAGCYGCHAIKQYKSRMEKRNIGPSLQRVSSKIKDQDWAKKWIKNPKDFRHNTWMPTFYGSGSEDPTTGTGRLLNHRYQDGKRQQDEDRRTDTEIHAITHYIYSNSDSSFDAGTIPVKGDKEIGRNTFQAVGCQGCHQVAPDPIEEALASWNPTDIAEKRNQLRREYGPNLIGIGSKTSAEWIYNWVKNPLEHNPNTKMPNLRLTDQEAANITAYLVSLDQKGFEQTTVGQYDDEMLDTIAGEFLQGSYIKEEVEAKLASWDSGQTLSYAGQKLINHYGCYGCHEIHGFEDAKPVGAELTYHGSKMVKKFDFGLVQSEYVDSHGHKHRKDHLPQTNSDWFTQKLKNPRIYDTNASVDLDTEKLANLDEVHVINEFRAFQDKLQMPNFGFTDREVEAIVTALMGFVKQEALDSKIMPRTAKNVSYEKGQSIVAEKNCQGCHLIEDQGHAIEPSLLDWMMEQPEYEDLSRMEAKADLVSFVPPNLIGEGQKVKPDWLYRFLRQPETIRPAVQVRMPTYNFTEGEINTLVKYFSYLEPESEGYNWVAVDDWQDNAFRDPHQLNLSTTELTAAEKLISKDGHHCGQCHWIGNQEPENKVAKDQAPSWALASQRLKPEWMARWIADAPALMPGTKMPTYYDTYDPDHPDLESYTNTTPFATVLDGDDGAQVHAIRDYVLKTE